MMVSVLKLCVRILVPVSVRVLLPQPYSRFQTGVLGVRATSRRMPIQPRVAVLPNPLRLKAVRSADGGERTRVGTSGGVRRAIRGLGFAPACVRLAPGAFIRKLRRDTSLLEYKLLVSLASSGECAEPQAVHALSSTLGLSCASSPRFLSVWTGVRSGPSGAAARKTVANEATHGKHEHATRRTRPGMPHADEFGGVGERTELRCGETRRTAIRGSISIRRAGAWTRVSPTSEGEHAYPEIGRTAEGKDWFRTFKE